MDNKIKKREFVRSSLLWYNIISCKNRRNGSDNMDMYQKRKIRAEKKSKQDDSKEFPSVNINWDVGINGNHHEYTEIATFL